MIPSGISEKQAGEIFARVDGLLFTGGGDIDPAIYGGTPNPHVYDVDPLRDALEVFLVRQAAENGFPFLGICRGIQVVNVALGGKLYTDIGDQLQGALQHDTHATLSRNEIAHEVKVNHHSRLQGLVGSELLPVNSFHHQGIQAVAPALQATGFSVDGLVEAVEIPGHPFGLGVQWHPECLPEMERMQAIFRGLVNAAGNG